MKHNLLIVLMLCVGLLANAQYQVTNSGFETFESDALHDNAGIRPTGWQASNVSQFGMQMTVLTQDNSGHTGNCAHLTNVTVIGQTSPAWISLGNPWAHVESLAKVGEATAGTDGGIAWTHRPDSMEVWIKRANNGSEEAFLVYYAWTGQSRGDSYMGKNGQCASTTHYDEESDIRQTTNGNDCGTAVNATQIAEGLWRNSGQFGTWTKIVVPITYMSNAAPAKMNIILSGGNYPNKRSTNVHEGSELWVDDLRLIYSSKAHELLLNNRKMSGFDQNTLTYTYSLGATATSVPTIVPKRSGRQLDPSEYTVNYAPLGDTTTVTIYAEDGSSTTTYKIMFTTQLSTNSRLADIQVAGESVTGFNPLIFNYNVELPFGTTTYPDITYTFAESGQTAVVNTPSTFPGTATVVCTAADGTTTSTYSLNFTVAALTDNTLTDIKVNGKTITGFRPTKNTYVVELPTGTTADPVITYTTAYPNDHIIVVTNNGLTGGATISVTPKGTTNTRTYRLTFLITASTYSYLQDIKLDGQSIPGFEPETLSYYDTLPIGTTAIPAITWVPGDEYQTIALVAGGIDGASRITVTSQSGATTVYRINFTTLKSSNADLAAIMLDGVPMTDFAPSTLSYTVNLPVGVSTVPTITYTPGDQYQTITLMDGGLSSPSRIVVRAGDGTTKTYTITFTSSQSSNCSLASLMLDGVQIEGWDPDVTDYSVSLPRGTTSMPAITWTTGDQYQTVRKSEGGVNGDTRITVKAQNGQSRVYVIHFSVLTNNCDYLTGIAVGGTPIGNFHQDTLYYNMVLPGGTTTLPEITYTKGDPSQSVALTRGGVNGVTTLVVRSESGSTRTYSITFSVTKSANALLQDIQMDGVSIPGFDPNTLNYDYVIPATATACPQVTVTKNQGQNVTITVPSLVGTVRITVTPETGAQNVYTINVHYQQSSVVALSGITVGGTPIAGFSAQTRNYDAQLNADGTMPTVVGIAGDPLQTIHTNSDPSTQTSYIYVRAESGDTAIYSVHFSRSASTISTLSDLKVDGVTIAGFAPATHAYNITLPVGTTVSPNITYTTTESSAKVTSTMPALYGRAEIEVTAEDGVSKTTYTVDIALAKSSDAALSAVTKNGVNIPMGTFVNDTATLNLAYGEAVPTIGYVRGNNKQMVMLANAGAQGTDIVVYAEDSTTRTYAVRYVMAKSTNSKLGDLNITGFNPNTTTYNIALPWRTRQQPVLEPRMSEEGQSVVVNYGGINGVTTVVVTAADGVSSTTYTINYHTTTSSIDYLEAIYYDGVLLPSFDRDRLNYTVTLPENTTTTPKLTWDLGVAPDGSDLVEQRVEYREGTLDDTSFVKVTAESGATRTYAVTYKISESDQANTLVTIALGGEAIAGFDPEVYNYSVALPSGTTTLPALTYVKRFQGQTVEVVSDGADGVTQLIVRSNRRTNDSTVYTIKTEVSTVSSARLTAVLVDGTPLANFTPSQTSYILSVTEQPTITFSEAAGCTATITTDNSKKMTVEVTDGTNTEYYNFHYYYANDVIPNRNFYSWVSASQKGSKPVGWKTPGDVAGCYKWTFLQTCTGSEVSPLGGTEGGVVLQTTREGDANAIYGSIPGMITTGNMSMSLTSTGNSTSSVSGSIPFRNTPQQLYVEYNPVSASNISSWRMWIKMFSGSTEKQSLFTGNFNNKNTWQNAALSIDYTGISTVTAMNICLNSGSSENAKDYGGATVCTSTVQFRNLHFIYNSALSGISVDGIPVAGFSSGTYDYTINLDAEYQGHPKVSMTGEVDDQEHRISWTNWYNGEMTASINVIAEDGEQNTNYYLHFTRGQSTISTLNGISLNGTQLSGFAPSTTTYNVVLPTGSRQLPDILVTKGSSNATVLITRSANRYTVKVTAENGTSTTYTINFTVADHTLCDLQSLTVEGHPEVVFNPATTTYNYTIGAYDGYPALTFARATEEQQVLCTDSKITVTAGDGVTTKVYNLNVTRTPVSAHAELNSIAIDGEIIQGFAPATHTYNFDMTGRSTYSYSFAGANESDTLHAESNTNSLVITVSGTQYTVNMTRTLSSDDRLMNLNRDGSSVAGFNDAIYNYNISLNKGEYPTFSTRANASDATLSLMAVDNGYDVQATAANGTTQHTTSIRMNLTKDTTTTLAAILIDGAMLSRSTNTYTSSSAFRSATTEYDITLLHAEPKMTQPQMPSVSAVASTEGQTVTISRGATTVITVRSEAGNEREYTLNFTTEQSNNTYLSDLAVNLQTVAGFAPTTTSYICSTELGEQPTITYTAGDAYQTVNVNTYSTHAEVVVTSESGSSRTYSITFVQSTSSDASINNLLIDGTPIPGFNPSVLDYTVQLPVGTSVAPTVTVVAGDDSQTVNVNEGGIDAPTSIVVTAGDGSTTRFYTVTFDVQKSSVDTLQMIYVDGVPVAGYEGTTQNYAFNLPIGVSALPLVTYDLGDEYQSAFMATDDENLISSIQVMAQDGGTRIYLLSFYTQQSHNAELQQIYVDGDSLAGFAPDSFNYVVNLPVGTTRIPELTWTEGDQYQQVTYHAATSTDGMADIRVVAGDTINKRNYSVIFRRMLSSNSQLSGITINGNPITSFDPDVYVYSDTLTAVPVIEFTPGDQYQTFDTVQGHLGGTHVIAVHAEDNTTSLYTIYLVLRQSQNATLAGISVAGEPLNSFDPENFEYVVTLPYGSTAMPAVTYTASEPALQLISARYAATANDTTWITVMAEDGEHVNTYIITYVHELSDNANISSVGINGEPLTRYAAGFSADQDFQNDLFLYNIVLPNGTNVLPDVIYLTEVPDIHSAVVDTIDTAAAFAPVLKITITSQNQRTINEYEFRFTVAPSTYALLADLQQADGLLKGFSPMIFDYEVTYPQGTDTASLPKVEDISYVAGDSTQKVTVAQISKTEISVTVMAEDKVTSNVYLITYRIMQSSNALLKDILVDGLSVSNFVPQKFEYEYLLNVGDTMPVLEGIPSDPLTQKVEVTKNFVNDTSFIYVTAEDGSSTTYKMLFKYTDVNTAQAPWNEEVAWIPLGDGYYRVSSMRKGVTLTITNLMGQVLMNEKVGLIDPNCDIHDERQSGGTIIHLERTDGYYIYTFWYNGKALKAGKFLR